MALSKLNMTERILFNVCTLKDAVKCEALFQNEKICNCKVNIDTVDHIWTISSWFTNENWKGQGIGKKTLAKALFVLYETDGIPKEIKYNWNGANDYVLEWMERHFDAECSCSIAVQKEQAADDWDSHEYNFNVSKVLDYFGIK